MSVTIQSAIEIKDRLSAETVRIVGVDEGMQCSILIGGVWVSYLLRYKDHKNKTREQLVDFIVDAALAIQAKWEAQA